MKKNDSKRILFADWISWRAYTEKAVVGFAKGFVLILYAIIAGVATLLYKSFVAIARVVMKYPVYTLTLLCLAMFVLLVLNYVRFSVVVKTAEAQRDSISYEIMKIEQAMGGDTIIIGSKTLRGHGANGTEYGEY